MNYRRLVTTAMSIAFLTLVAAAAFAADAPGAVEIYKTKCASCHGPDGAGQTPAGKAMKVRDLRSAEVQKESDADLLKSISDGKGKMPAYKAKLSVADVASLVAYIRGLAKK
jgi:mono/diheme cytochrome c family protein